MYPDPVWVGIHIPRYRFDSEVPVAYEDVVSWNVDILYGPNRVKPADFVAGKQKHAAGSA